MLFVILFVWTTKYLLYALSDWKYECESIGASVKFTDTQRLCLCTPLHNEAMHVYLLMIHTLHGIH